MVETKTNKETENKKQEVNKENKENKENILESRRILIKPVSTEKSIRLMESNNTLVFIVDNKANKKDIKEFVEKLFDVKVVKVNTMITPQGKKKAYIKFSEETPAIDISTKLGLI